MRHSNAAAAIQKFEKAERWVIGIQCDGVDKPESAGSAMPGAGNDFKGLAPV